MMLVAPQAESRRVAIVEDEGILALDIERHLRSRGFEICGVAADSDEALQLVERCKPDLVLMDIRIQGSRDGIETAAELKRRFGTPVVYLTAHSDPSTIDRAQRTAPMGYLLKPFKKPDLENLVHIALNRAELEARLRRRESTLNTTLEIIDEAIITTDGTGLVQWVNAAASALMGRTVSELENRPLHEVLDVSTSTGQPFAEWVSNLTQKERVAAARRHRAHRRRHGRTAAHRRLDAHAHRAPRPHRVRRPAQAR